LIGGFGSLSLRGIDMKWIRPSGTEIETNDRDVTIEYCESLGWERAENPKESVTEPVKSVSAPKKKAAKKKKAD
jgi:hypothetical protein